MEEALYGQGGYYDCDDPAIGPGGDFITGASASPFFGRMTARLLTALGEELPGPADYLEAGYGGGQHLRAMVGALEDEEGLVERRILAWDRIERAVPAGVVAVRDLEAVAARSISGLVFSYELFDALAVHRLVRRGDELRELLVGERDGCFEWLEGGLADPDLHVWNLPDLVEGQVIDVTPQWAAVYRDLAQRLDSGLVVTCDYGFSRHRLFDVRVRRHGTLACYRRHRVHRDPFVDFGRQDMTAHVDFTTLIEAGEAEGLETVGLFRQAEWLAGIGLLEGMPDRSPEERIEIMQLMDLEGMGEEIRVLVQARGVDPAKVLPHLA